MKTGRPNKTGIVWRSNSLEEKVKMRKYSRDYRKRHKERRYKSRKTSELKTKYDISFEEFEKKLKDQDARCAICNEVSILHVDHCHTTGKFRGLLCRHCNLGLGFFKDNKILMKKALDYLV